jgi:hypothetical protein
MDNLEEKDFQDGYHDYRQSKDSLYYESHGVYYRRLPLGGVALTDDRVRAQRYIDGYCQGESDSHD